jgi:peptidoglycan/LPS O-acetylase OafA/YrhL
VIVLGAAAVPTALTYVFLAFQNLEPQMKVPNRLSGYMPTLDGWRAISIILVLLRHSRVSAAIPVIGPFLWQVSEHGAIGVYVFFAISGVLICGRMLQEEQKHGRISLGNFYIRRAFRILPPALLYLLTLAVLSPIPGVTRLELVSALFFFRNYVLVALPPAYWFTGHFWSLAVEEHFYLLLPGILFFFPKRRAWVLGALTLAVFAWRSWLAHTTSLDLGSRTDTVLDALLIPALITIAANNDRYAVHLRRFLKPSFSAVLLAIFLALLFIKVPFNLVLRATILPLLLLGTSQHPENLVGRILESAPLRWIGRLSYSLYLWQQLFFCDQFWSGALPLGMLQQWPMKLVGLIGCASISYYVLERPMVRLGHRLASSGVPGRNVDLAPTPVPLVSSKPQEAGQ